MERTEKSIRVFTAPCSMLARLVSERADSDRAPKAGCKTQRSLLRMGMCAHVYLRSLGHAVLCSIYVP
jgi:hypothetical protein